jgi:hypothetical protein
MGRCTTKPKSTAFTTLVRPVLEYASPVLDSQLITITRDIEEIQRRAARFAYSCYQDNSSGCVTNLLNSFQWESLQQRRWKQTLVMCYKIYHQLFAVEPANYYTAGTSEQEETIDSDRSEPRRTHTNIPSSRDPSGNGIEYHLQL